MLNLIPHWRRQPKLSIWCLLVQYIGAQIAKFYSQNITLKWKVMLKQLINLPYKLLLKTSKKKLIKKQSSLFFKDQITTLNFGYQVSPEKRWFAVIDVII